MSAFRSSMCAAAVCLLVASGCERPASPPQTAPPPQPTTLKTATPLEATRSVLLLLADMHYAAQKDDAARISERKAQIAAYLVARDALLAHTRANTPELGERVVNAAVDSWAGMVAYYAEGLDLVNAQQFPTSSDARAVVLVQARGPSDTAIFEVACQQLPDQSWRISDLRFAPRPDAPRTESAPTTQP